MPKANLKKPVKPSRASKAPAVLKKLLDGKPSAKTAEKTVESKAGTSVPVYKENSELPPEIEALAIEHRPMIWRDLSEFCARHSRTIADIVYDLALLTSHAYATKTPQRTVMPFDLELLARLYDLYPSSCAWKRPDVRDTFEILYGEHINSFEKKYQAVARLALGRRYARLLGRVDTAQYRWLADGGQITRRLSNILAKIDAIAGTGDDPREVFERVAKHVWTLRGVNIDAEVPMPTKLSVLKPPGTRGRRMTGSKLRKEIVQPTYAGGAFGS